MIHARAVARRREFETEEALAHAAEAFRDQGYGSMSMRDLSTATGVAVGSLYTAFGSKDGLYRAALAQYGQDLGARMQRLLARDGARQSLRTLLLDHVAEVTADPNWPGCLLIGAATERSCHDAEVHAQVRGALAGMSALLAELIRRGQRDGELRAEVDPDDAAELLVMLLNGIRVVGTADPDTRRLTAAVDLALSAL